MSGTTISTPKSSASGNIKPASTTMMSSPQRTAMQFIPNSPRPPRGTKWSFPEGIGKLDRSTRFRAQQFVRHGPSSNKFDKSRLHFGILCGLEFALGDSSLRRDTMSRVFQYPAIVLMVVFSVAAVAADQPKGDQQKAEKQLRMITAMSRDDTARTII